MQRGWSFIHRDGWCENAVDHSENIQKEVFKHKWRKLEETSWRHTKLIMKMEDEYAGTNVWSIYETLGKPVMIINYISMR